MIFLELLHKKKYIDISAELGHNPQTVLDTPMYFFLLRRAKNQKNNYIEDCLSTVLYCVSSADTIILLVFLFLYFTTTHFMV